MSSENTDIRNRRFYERKEFWIALASVAVAVCVRYAVEKHNDRPLTFRPVESVDAEPDYAHGVGIDFRRRLEARQEANLMPADENGWKLVLQAFGPIALDHKSFVERTPWEQLAGEYWFKREWTPLCEKYGIDPTVPPEFLTRLDLYEYLIKNGKKHQLVKKIRDYQEVREVSKKLARQLEESMNISFTEAEKKKEAEAKQASNSKGNGIQMIRFYDGNYIYAIKPGMIGILESGGSTELPDETWNEEVGKFNVK